MRGFLRSLNVRTLVCGGWATRRAVSEKPLLLRSLVRVRAPTAQGRQHRSNALDAPFVASAMPAVYRSVRSDAAMLLLRSTRDRRSAHAKVLAFLRAGKW